MLCLPTPLVFGDLVVCLPPLPCLVDSLTGALVGSVSVG